MAEAKAPVPRPLSPHLQVYGVLILLGYTWALMHHMLGGVRHFVWDFGHGMGATERLALARFTLVGSVALTVLIWLVAFLVR